MLSLWMIVAAYTTKDPEGMLLCALVGGVGVAFAAPFWALFRGRLPLWVVLPLVAAVLFGVLEFNAWAEETAQDYRVHPHFYDYWRLLLFLTPGLAFLLWNSRRRKPDGQSQRTVDPPRPPVV